MAQSAVVRDYWALEIGRQRVKRLLFTSDRWSRSTRESRRSRRFRLRRSCWPPPHSAFRRSPRSLSSASLLSACWAVTSVGRRSAAGRYACPSGEPLRWRWPPRSDASSASPPG